MPGSVLKDNQVKGLQLRTFNGGKYWYVYYRINGQQRKPKIGQWPTLTLSQARDAARQMLAKVAQGQDPSKDRVGIRQAPTVKDLADRYMREHGNQKKDCRNDEGRWRIHILPAIGNYRLQQVTRQDIIWLVDRIGIHSQVNRNRVLAMLSKAFNLAKAWGWYEGDNPCRQIKKSPEIARKPYLNSSQLTSLIQCLKFRKKRWPSVVALFQLIIMTGSRLNELQTAKWCYLQEGALHLPDSKTGEKKIYLSPEALAIINSQPRINEYIFPGLHGKGHLCNPYKAWNEIRQAAGLPWLRIHDLRHNYAAIALSAGLELSQIGELLGHRSTQTTKRYASLKDDAARHAAERISKAITGFAGL
jgi:integrase